MSLGFFARWRTKRHGRFRDRTRDRRGSIRTVHQTLCACRYLQSPNKCAWPVQTRTPPTSYPIQPAGAPTSVHRILDPLRSDAHFAAQQPRRRRRLPSQHIVKATRPLLLGPEFRFPTAACFARVDGTYPAYLQPSLAAGKMLRASTHLLQIPQPAPPPQRGYAASAPLPLRS